MTVSNKPVILFGTGDLARRLRYYFGAWTDQEVVAMTVDAKYLTEAKKDDTPVVAFEEIADLFPPEDHAFFCCIGYKDRNRGREEKFAAAERIGYEMVSLVCPTSPVSNARIGAGTLVCEGASLGPNSEIGRGVVVSSVAHVSHDSRIGDFCFLSVRATVAGRCKVGDFTMIGASATLGDHVEIPAGCLIGAGSVVIKNPTRPGIYLGNPARYLRPWE